MHLSPRLTFQAVLKIVVPCRVCILLALAIPSVAQTALPPHSSDTHSLTITVLDENGVAVPDARVRLQGPAKSLQCETDLTGHCKLTGLTGAPWHIRVDKEGFYAADVPAVQDSGTLEVDIHHQEEVRENVSVVESVPEIDPAQIVIVAESLPENAPDQSGSACHEYAHEEASLAACALEGP